MHRWIVCVLWIVCAWNVQAQSSVDGLDVVDATVRVPLPGKNLTSAYFLLRNTSERARTLVAVEAAFAERAELHSHRMADGMMQMRQVDSVPVPAGASVRFHSGGHHVMLFNLEHRPRTGDPLKLVLRFKDGTSLPVKAYAVSVFDQPRD